MEKDLFGKRIAKCGDLPPNPNPYWYLYKKMRTDGKLIDMAGIVDKDVLNIGCFYPYDELTYGNLVRRWVAIDVSEEAVRGAKTAFEKHRDNIPSGRVTFKVMDAQRMDFRDNEFEVVLCLSVIEHIPSYEKRLELIREMARVSSDFVIITTTDIDNKEYREFHSSVKYKEFYGGDFYEKLYTKKEFLNELMTAFSFKVLEYVQYGPRMGYLLKKPRN